MLLSWPGAWQVQTLVCCQRICPSHSSVDLKRTCPSRHSSKRQTYGSISFKMCRLFLVRCQYFGNQPLGMCLTSNEALASHLSGSSGSNMGRQSFELCGPQPSGGAERQGFASLPWQIE